MDLRWIFSVRSIGVHPRGRQGSAGRDRGNVLAWDRATGQIETLFGEVQEGAESVAVSARADLLAVALYRSSKRGARLWSLTSKQTQGTIDLPPTPNAHLRAALQDLALPDIDPGESAAASKRRLQPLMEPLAVPVVSQAPRWRGKAWCPIRVVRQRS